MTFNLKLLEKYLNLLLLFLFPTQLALHFWPKFAFVFGIRVDYLSPTIYLTDVLFLGLFSLWFIRNEAKVLSDVVRFKYIILVIFIVAATNTIFSSSSFVSAVKWFKLIEFMFLAYYAKRRKDVFDLKTVAKVLFYSLCFFSVIGIIQFALGRTMGGVLYLLGERSFSIFTPGIAIINFLGKNYLRIYSTFSHPNSFAGFLGVCFIFFAFKLNNSVFAKIFGYLLMGVAFLLTFSTSAFIALFFSAVLYLVFKKNIYDKQIFNYLFILILIASLYFSLVSKPLLETNFNFLPAYRERIVLADISGEMFSARWLTGVGLNTFVINEISNVDFNRIVWLLQPVHNIYLLIFSETGVVGILLIYLFVTGAIRKYVFAKNKWALLVIVFILITGLFDHYWITIQQNLLLISFFFGISFREKV